MNKKLLLGALIGAGMSMLNKKMRQASAPGATAGHPDLGQPGAGRPDFSNVPPPTQTGGADAPSLDDILAHGRQYLDALVERLGISEQAAQVIEQQLPR